MRARGRAPRHRASSPGTASASAILGHRPLGGWQGLAPRLSSRSTLPRARRQRDLLERQFHRAVEHLGDVPDPLALSTTMSGRDEGSHERLPLDPNELSAP
jgi:hypothetical protein